MTVNLTPIAFALLAGALPAQKSESTPSFWPDFRGPNRNGHVAGQIPTSWSEKENVRWKTPVPGEGWSSPVHADGKVWFTTARKGGRSLHVLAFDLDTGNALHDVQVFEVSKPEPKNKLNSYASPSPVVADGRVFVHFGTYGTAGLDTATGKVLWRRDDIHCDHIVGPGSSPTSHRGQLIFHMDGGDVQFVIALDEATGETRWRKDRDIDFAGVQPDLRKAYSTPVFFEDGDAVCMLSTAARATIAYDPMTGGELWRVPHGGFSMSSRPVLTGDGLAVINTGFMKTELLAIKLAGEPGVREGAIEWRWRRSVPRMASPVLVQHRLHFVSDSGVATCLDVRTGKQLWKNRIGGEHCASPIASGNRVFFFDREGRTVVIQSGDEFEQIGENQLDDGFMSSPAADGDALILRTKTHLYRIEAGQ